MRPWRVTAVVSPVRAIPGSIGRVVRLRTSRFFAHLGEFLRAEAAQSLPPPASEREKASPGRGSLSRKDGSMAAKEDAAARQGAGYMMSIAAVSTTTSTMPVTTITFITHLSMVAYCTFASARPASTAPFSGVMMATRPWAAT